MDEEIGQLKQDQDNLSKSIDRVIYTLSSIIFIGFGGAVLVAYWAYL